MSLILFVGGGQDGSRLNISDATHVVECPTANPYLLEHVIEQCSKEGGEIQKQLYHRMKLQADDKIFEIFRYEGITASQVMEALIRGYTFTFKHHSDEQ